MGEPMNSRQKPSASSGNRGRRLTADDRGRAQPRPLYLPSEVRLRNLEMLLEHAASRDMTLKDIAAAFGVCPAHLVKLFKRKGFHSPVRLVRELRLAKALDRILKDHTPLDALAQEFGYADASSLRRGIRRVFGQSLAELRNRGVASLPQDLAHFGPRQIS